MSPVLLTITDVNFEALRVFSPVDLITTVFILYPGYRKAFYD